MECTAFLTFEGHLFYTDVELILFMKIEEFFFFSFIPDDST